GRVAVLAELGAEARTVTRGRRFASARRLAGAHVVGATRGGRAGGRIGWRHPALLHPGRGRARGVVAIEAAVAAAVAMPGPGAVTVAAVAVAADDDLGIVVGDRLLLEQRDRDHADVARLALLAGVRVADRGEPEGGDVGL